MRIGTWNLAGRWDQRHRALIEAMDCDLLLLTEVSECVELPGLRLHLSKKEMAAGRRWAAIASRRPLEPLRDPHGASVVARVDDLVVCSSILPWRASGDRNPWVGRNTAERTADAAKRIEAARPDVWGGDWNHALSGREWAGSKEGRQHILGAVERLGLQVPTADAPHQIEGLLAIDHVAVPRSWVVLDVERHRAHSSGAEISDHDAYVAEVQPHRGTCSDHSRCETCSSPS